MDRFHQLQVFVAVAEETGFAAASRRLNLSPPAVTRAVAALEDRLGVRLFNRTTRYVHATEAGQRYLEDARQILEELEVADGAAAGVNAEPRGHLAITAPALFGRTYVTPAIVDYLDRHPATRVNAVFLDRVVNLLEEGFDVGVRIGALPDSSMRARRVGQVRLVLCASPGYLEAHGEPASPDDLLQHSIIASRTSAAFDWRFGGKEDHNVRLQPRLAVNTNDAAIRAASLGFGITRLLSYQSAEYVASGELQYLLEDYEPPPRPVHIVHREARHGSAKVRSFIDILAAHLGSHPDLQPASKQVSR